MHPNGLINLIEIRNQDFLGEDADASFELKTHIFWEIGPCTFKSVTLYHGIMKEETLQYMLKHRPNCLIHSIDDK